MSTSGPPLGNRTTYSYDLAGQQTSRQDARGNRITYSYDLAGRQIALRNELNPATRLPRLQLLGQRLRPARLSHDEHFRSFFSIMGVEEVMPSANLNLDPSGEAGVDANSGASGLVRYSQEALNAASIVAGQGRCRSIGTPKVRIRGLER